jgi:hypothetical protein
MVLDAHNLFIRCSEFTPLHCQTGKPLLYHSKGCQDWTSQRRKVGWKLGMVYVKSKKLNSGGCYVTPKELAECRLDPAWEARRKMLRYAVCRICGALRTRIGEGKLGHLMQMHPEVAPSEYCKLYPHAPLRDIRNSARDYRTSAERLAAKLASQYVTGDELIACRANPNWEIEHSVKEYVVCRVCNWKSHVPLNLGKGGHLRTHGLTWREYLTQFPEAPRAPLTFMEKARSNARANREEFKRLRAESEELRKLRNAGMLSPKKDVGGRPEGMTEERQKKARELLRYIQEFIDKNHHDDGSIAHAAKKAYPNVALRTAKDRANKTLKDYRNFVKAQKPSAS